MCYIDVKILPKWSSVREEPTHPRTRSSYDHPSPPSQNRDGTLDAAEFAEAITKTIGHDVKVSLRSFWDPLWSQQAVLGA